MSGSGLSIVPPQGVAARKNSAGTEAGPKRRVNFIEGTNITLTVAQDDTDQEIDVTIDAAGASGAPTDADYLVGTTQSGLSAEIVVGATPGGELGGTWASPTVDATHSGSAHHTQSHNHSAAGDGTTLTPAVLNVPNAAAPTPTVEGQAYWDSDDDKLVVGDGVGQKIIVPTASFSGDATVATTGALTVAGTHSGSAHHTQSHDHSAAGDGQALAPGTSITIPNTGLLVKDTDASHTLAITPGSNLTANRILTLTTGDAARNLTLNADTTLSGTNTGDQTITLTGEVTGSGVGSFAATVAATHSGSAHSAYLAVAGTDIIKDTHIDWGSGASQVDMADIPGGVAPASAFDFGAASSLEVPNGAGGTTVDATGELTVDSTSRTLNFYDGTIEAVLLPIQTKSFVLIAPVATDDYPLMKMPAASTLIQVDYVITGATNWIGQLQEGDANGANGVDTQAADSTATTTNVQVTSFSNATLDAGDWLLLKSTSISGTPTSLSITFQYRQDA